MGLGKTPLITFDESIEQPVTILFPGTLACHQIDGAQEPYDINSGRAYELMRKIFPTWRDVADADAKELEHAIKVGGLARQKSKVIQDVYDARLVL